MHHVLLALFQRYGYNLYSCGCLDRTITPLVHASRPGVRLLQTLNEAVLVSCTKYHITSRAAREKEDITTTCPFGEVVVLAETMTKALIVLVAMTIPHSMIPPSVLAVASVSAVIVLGLNAQGAKSVVVQMDYIKFVKVVCLIQVVRHVMR